MPRKYIVVLILFCIALNAAGFLWKIFEPVLFYDEVAHFITPFTLVLILAEIIYRSGGDDEFFDGGIIEACRRLADAGNEVIAAGLDMD
ncbi:MAG TPA: hypothetical protein VFQ09_00195, partial [Rubrobacter sp.]|nr:hypothetical protein [Rubrobacter sp.]